MQLKNTRLLKNQAYINGQWVSNSNTITVTNPATGEDIGTVPDLGETETLNAIKAADEALIGWSKKTAKERSIILKKWNSLILENHDDLAKIMVTEQGKPFLEAKGEIAYGASFIEWFAEEAKRVYGDVISSAISSQRLIVIKQPIGVVAAITPWNFPFSMITRKCAPALAAGCTVVVKPSELTPFSALALAELAEQAGIPPGVLNFITTSDAPAVGTAMTSHPSVRKLSFTGSTAVGKILTSACAGTMKKVSMELGGNAPFIVFNDADLDAAVLGAMASKYRNAGQTCVCTNRFLIQDDIYDEFAEKLKEAVAKLNVGNGIDDGVNQGPLINEGAVVKVESQINDALSKGATIALGGKRLSAETTFFEPTILTDVDPSMIVSREETFGPVAPLFRFKTEEDAIQMANDTEFGLAAYFYSRDIGRCWRVGEALEYGMVGINEGIISNEVAPFGGVKESGLGREGSKFGIEEFLEIKYMCLGGIYK